MLYYFAIFFILGAVALPSPIIRKTEETHYEDIQEQNELLDNSRLLKIARIKRDTSDISPTKKDDAKSDSNDAIFKFNPFAEIVNVFDNIRKNLFSGKRSIADQDSEYNNWLIENKKEKHEEGNIVRYKREFNETVTNATYNLFANETPLNTNSTNILNSNDTKTINGIENVKDDAENIIDAKETNKNGTDTFETKSSEKTNSNASDLATNSTIDANITTNTNNDNIISDDKKDIKDGLNLNQTDIITNNGTLNASNSSGHETDESINDINKDQSTTNDDAINNSFAINSTISAETTVNSSNESNITIDNNIKTNNIKIKTLDSSNDNKSTDKLKVNIYETPATDKDEVIEENSKHDSKKDSNKTLETTKAIEKGDKALSLDAKISDKPDDNKISGNTRRKSDDTDDEVKESKIERSNHKSVIFDVKENRNASYKAKLDELLEMYHKPISINIQIKLG